MYLFERATGDHTTMKTTYALREALFIRLYRGKGQVTKRNTLRQHFVTKSAFSDRTLYHVRVLSTHDGP